MTMPRMIKDLTIDMTFSIAVGWYCSLSCAICVSKISCKNNEKITKKLQKINQTRLKIFSVHKRDLYVDNIDNVDKITFSNKITFLTKLLRYIWLSRITGKEKKKKQIYRSATDRA